MVPSAPALRLAAVSLTHRRLPPILTHVSSGLIANAIGAFQLGVLAAASSFAPLQPRPLAIRQSSVAARQLPNVAKLSPVGSLPRQGTVVRAAENEVRLLPTATAIHHPPSHHPLANPGRRRHLPVIIHHPLPPYHEQYRHYPTGECWWVQLAVVPRPWYQGRCNRRVLAAGHHSYRRLLVRKG